MDQFTAKWRNKEFTAAGNLDDEGELLVSVRISDEKPERLGTYLNHMQMRALHAHLGVLLGIDTPVGRVIPEAEPTPEPDPDPTQGRAPWLSEEQTVRFGLLRLIGQAFNAGQIEDAIRIARYVEIGK